MLKRLKEKHSFEKGTVYGRLTLTGVSYLKAAYGKLKRVVEADCDCGVIREYWFDLITRGDTRSCGCLRNEATGNRARTHGLSRHPLYDVHRSMQKRCYVPTDVNYVNYGKRGIDICDQWLDNFLEFYVWAVENGYTSELSIDRIDNSKGYSPENCRWVERKVQSRNNRRNKMITAFGETKCLFDWGKDERCAVGVWGLRNRFDRGQWTDMEAMISTPNVDRKEVSHRMKNNVNLTAFGETKCMSEWLRDERCKVKIDSLRDRLEKGMDAEIAISKPPTRKNGVLFL